MHLKMSSVKWRAFCLCLNVLILLKMYISSLKAHMMAITIRNCLLYLKALTGTDRPISNGDINRFLFCGRQVQHTNYEQYVRNLELF